MQLQWKSFVIAASATVVSLSAATAPSEGLASPKAPVAALTSPALAFSLLPATAISAPLSTGDPYCWFCWKYEDYAFNPLTEQYELADHAFCEPMNNLPGGAIACFDYANAFNEFGVWEGGECWSMWMWTSESGGWQECVCDEEYPILQMYHEHCVQEAPVSEISSDGYLAMANVASDSNLGHEDERACNGAVRGSRLTADETRHIEDQTAKLTI